ncbi:TonB-dependent receptor domain-containing protein [Neptunitalea lumnitzerae]|uniref:TonB-dependent receptor n=1 Tax=Neptunitalea lumnitzerae TaxID=2965509 RepID=A0ABQ5MKV3_9FLAO|nr:TonB-dependent receptor [Neptunitalea sp. Y10]GLB49685.1 TonB-dependent receptor [Neptunitalea sp. Y10]
MLSLFSSFAQEGKTIKVTGTVIDRDTNEPLEYATLVLQNTATQQVTGGVTDMNGKFNVETTPGTYNIRVEFISYSTYQLNNQTLTADKDMGVVKLGLDVAQLDAVEVSAEKTTVELRLDKKVYNVGSDMTVKGGSITDVLDNVPSVTVDVEGGISLRGNENVRILINGKPSALSGLDNNALQQIPSDAIEKVEVITNPSSRYDAQGTAGIINIVLKKGKALGVNGSVNAFAGNPDNFGGSLNLNLRSQKFNIFTNTSYRYRNAPGNALYEQENLDPDNGTTTGFQDEYRNYDRMGNNFSTNVGVEFYIDSTSSITNSVVYRTQDGTDETNIDLFNYNPNRTLLTRRNRFTKQEDNEEAFQYALNYEKRFKKDGHKLTVDYQFSRNDELEDSYINERVIGSDTIIAPERTFQDNNNNSHLVQADYILPLGENGNSQLEAGYRGNFNDYETVFRYGQLLDDGSYNENFANYTNTLFNYSEKINAAYIQYGTKLGKWNVLGGLRMEDTNISIEPGQDYDATTKKYTNWFPSVFLGYEFSEKTQLTVSYSRRLRRPWSRFLNPYPNYSSNTNLFQGNPDIDPTFTNAYDLGFIQRWDKFTLSTSAYYNRSTGTFQFVTLDTDDVVEIDNPEYDENDPVNDPTSPNYDPTAPAAQETIEVPVQVRTPLNVGVEERYGLEFTSTYNPIKKWRLSGNVNLFQQNVMGSYSYTNYNTGLQEEKDFSSNNFSWFARLTSKVTLPAAVEFQANMMYRGPSKNAQSENEGMFSTNLAFSKEVFNENATVSLNVSDLFNSRKRRSTTFTDSAITYSEFQWRERQITVNFMYRFNMKKNDFKRNRGNEQMPGGGDDMEFGG